MVDVNIIIRKHLSEREEGMDPLPHGEECLEVLGISPCRPEMFCHFSFFLVFLPPGPADP